jgi:glucose-1-phosphate thymidylyltransferase
MKALILAAGYATRLYPLTREYPKPLLKVGKRPIIDYIIDKVSILEDIDEIIVVTNSKFFPIFKKWAVGVKIKQRFTLVDDLTKSHADRLGAIGDMSFAIEQKGITDDLLVVGGDNLFDGELHDFLSFAKTKNLSPVIGAYDIKDKGQAKKYGVIKIDAQSRIIDFKEKPGVPKYTVIAMCLYYFPKGKLGLIRQYLESKADKHDATGFYIDWLRKKERVYGFVFNGRWYDIGHHEVYSQAKERFK